MGGRGGPFPVAAGDGAHTPGRKPHPHRAEHPIRTLETDLDAALTQDADAGSTGHSQALGVVFARGRPGEFGDYSTASPRPEWKLLHVEATSHFLVDCAVSIIGLSNGFAGPTKRQLESGDVGGGSGRRRRAVEPLSE